MSCEIMMLFVFLVVVLYSDFVLCVVGCESWFDFCCYLFFVVFNDIGDGVCIF